MKTTKYCHRKVGCPEKRIGCRSVPRHQGPGEHLVGEYLYDRGSRSADRERRRLIDFLIEPARPAITLVPSDPPLSPPRCPRPPAPRDRSCTDRCLYTLSSGLEWQGNEALNACASITRQRCSLFSISLIHRLTDSRGKNYDDHALTLPLG